MAPRTAAPRVVDRVAAALGTRAVAWERPECGLSAAERWSVRLADETAVFVKAATDDQTASWLSNERFALEQIGTDFGPGIVAWLDDDHYPVLVSQDLSDAYWPAGTGTVHWRNGDIDAVMTLLEQLRAVPPPPGLREVALPDPRWSQLLTDGALVRAGLCTEAWVSRHAAAITEADRSVAPAAPGVAHGDVRSDNVCILRDGTARLVDWSHAGVGHPLADLVGLLPTLRLEGGPRPGSLLREPVGLIVRMCGVTVDRSIGDVSGPGWLRRVMIDLAHICLEWVSAVVGADSGLPDGDPGP